MDDKPKIRKPWGGRFNTPTDAFVETFTASVTFDQRLAMCDIRGSIAHVTMLSETGIISEEEKKLIIDGLEGIKVSIKSGDFSWSVALEDVHMNIEYALVEAIGEVGNFTPHDRETIKLPQTFAFI
jgi:argininosuccinate lyase